MENLLINKYSLESHTCNQCGKSYKWKGSLLHHIRNECGKQPKHYCNMCTYVTKRNSDLLRHLRSVHKMNLSKRIYCTRYKLQDID